MPKIRWKDLPPALREHPFDRLRQAPPSQVLLVAEAVVSRDQRIESGFRCGEKLPVLKGCPAGFVRGRDRMTFEEVAERSRYALRA
jgi:hypothetical protein